MSVLYLTRDDWGADPALGRLGHVVEATRWQALVTHHTVFALRDYDGDGLTDGDLDDIKRFMRLLQRIRPDLGLDVPYSFVVFHGVNGYSSVVCEGRGLNRTGAHTAGQNSKRIGVAVAGNTSTQPISEGIIEGIRFVGGMLPNPNLADTLPHRAFSQTECSGSSMVGANHRVQPPFNAVSLDGGEDGMTLLYDSDSRTWRVAVPGEGSAVVSEPDHWREVIADGRATGVYKSPWMSDLIDKIRAERAVA